jgi:hypothetical protein
MRKEKDILSDKILNIILKSNEPLETREIELVLKGVSRVMILYRLNVLRGDGTIRGKPVGSGKGTWIWWKK